MRRCFRCGLLDSSHVGLSFDDDSFELCSRSVAHESVTETVVCAFRGALPQLGSCFGFFLFRFVSSFLLSILFFFVSCAAFVFVVVLRDCLLFLLGNHHRHSRGGFELCELCIGKNQCVWSKKR